VDLETEAGIIEAMDRLAEGRTTFLITHRPGTLEQCEQLLVIRDGRLTMVSDGQRPLRKEPGPELVVTARRGKVRG
jgi:ABC-type multidrug transport system fused ATPase/permease subunit